MRSPQIGAIGASALTLTLLMQVNALTMDIANHRDRISAARGLTGRLAVLWSMPARGAGSPVERPRSVGRRNRPATLAVSWTLAVAAEAFAYGRLDRDGGTLRGGLRAVIALFLALGVTWLVRRHAVRRLGGITGDVLGALVEIATSTVLLVMAVQFPYGQTG